MHTYTHTNYQTSSILLHIVPTRSKLLPWEPMEKVPTTKFFTRLRDLIWRALTPTWVSLSRGKPWGKSWF